jgi:hypothetical protein
LTSLGFEEPSEQEQEQIEEAKADFENKAAIKEGFVSKYQKAGYQKDDFWCAPA